MIERDIAVEAALAAGLLLRGADGPQHVSHKGRIDLVTEMDVRCEEAVRGVLAKRSPDVPVVGEEGGGDPNGRCWLVDPLDGTTNFVHGFPQYSVSVAYLDEGQSLVGVVYDPVRDRLFEAVRGEGARCNGRRIWVSGVDRLQNALVGTGFPYDRRENADRYLAPFREFLARTHGVRRMGSAALDLAMVATGSLDGFWEFGLKPWDVAAGMLLVEEAGGQVTNHEGQPLDIWSPSPLASNKHLHPSMKRLLERVRKELGS